MALGFLSWLVTRWRVDQDDLQIEMGLLRRQSLRFPLSQVQAIDVVRPGLARLFGVAELRLRMGGASGKTARLAYLHEREVEPLRRRLLALAERGVEEPEEPRQEVARDERVLTRVPTGRLVASILISDVGIVAEAVAVGMIATVVVAPGAATGVVGGGAVWIISVVQLVWRRFNQEYRLSVVATPDGLLLRGGLVALTAETIRPGRVQAVRMVEPLLWRLLGWCRLEVDLAGRQRSEGEGQAQRRALRTVLPVGSRALAEELLDHLLPDRPRAQDRGAAPRAVEEPAALSHARLGTNGDVRRDDERAAAARDELGAAREGAEPAARPGPGAAPSTARERSRRHGGPQRARGRFAIATSPRPTARSRSSR